MPDAFIPEAEANGMIAAIDRWVIETACKQHLAWRTEGLSPGRLAVNVSPLLFQKHEITRIVANCMSEYSIPSGSLELELTESMLLEGSGSQLDLLRSLNGMGIRIAIDDFGTGYSSLAYLRKFPLNTLKIDRAFIENLPEDTMSSAILASISSLAKIMTLNVVAEGVETHSQCLCLKSLGIDHGQGFKLGRPVDAEGIRSLLTSRVSGDPEPIAVAN